MNKAVWIFSLLLAAGLAGAAELDRTPLEAVTAHGEKVRLFPNGRWEFVDTAKAAEAQQQAAQYPENKTRPVEAQGGLFGGFGRNIMPGDKDYNRGSLNPKNR
ncbi:MAG: hypothetical protein WAV95_16275 [Azonexus sp.]